MKQVKHILARHISIFKCTCKNKLKIKIGICKPTNYSVGEKSECYLCCNCLVEKFYF